MTERIKSLDEIQDPDKFLNAYYGAMEDAKTLREEKKALEEEKSALEQTIANTDNTELDKWKSRAIKAEARSALAKDGVGNSDRILKYINLDGVDIDDDGNLTGFDDKLSEVKNDFPELFDKKVRAGRQSADIHADTASKTVKSATEQQLDALFG